MPPMAIIKCLLFPIRFSTSYTIISYILHDLILPFRNAPESDDFSKHFCTRKVLLKCSSKTIILKICYDDFLPKIQNWCRKYKKTPVKRGSQETEQGCQIDILLWRKREDSNLRYGCPHTRFPSVLLKPLGHTSVSSSISHLSPLFHSFRFKTRPKKTLFKNPLPKT